MTASTTAPAIAATTNTTGYPARPSAVPPSLLLRPLSQETLARRGPIARPAGCQPSSHSPFLPNLHPPQEDIIH